jgi:hypothetical protein
MYVVSEYPAVSETYIKSEIEALVADYDVRVIASNKAQIPYKNHAPFRHLTEPEMILEAVREFRPHVLHGHWLYQAEILFYLSERTGIPFTIRAHSFDAIAPGNRATLVDANSASGSRHLPTHLREAAPLINSDWCLGVLSFPFTLPLLGAAGIHPKRLFPCYPVVDYRRFHNTYPNGDSVMNVGACLPKKKMADFLQLATEVRGMAFNLYPLGHQIKRIEERNRDLGHPVNISPPIEPDDMPREYKKHRWLVYTACTELKTVGWPLSVAEAQASGVGVCIQNLRPDLREYVGEAGYLFTSLGEVAEIISKPFPEEKRQLGFEHAKKSDIAAHKGILTDLWQRAISGGAQ